MKKQQFNPEEYAKLKHRVEALKSRIKLDSGPEQETAIRLLAKVEKRLKIYEETHEIPKQTTKDYNTTTNYDFEDFFKEERVKKAKTNQSFNYENSWNPNPNFKWNVHFEEDKKYYEDTRSEEEMMNDLGVLYAIFGSTYQTILNYRVYKIRFKKKTKKEGAFYRVYCDIYEDDIRICNDVIIGFWPFRFGDDKCGDMQLCCMNVHDIDKYDNEGACFYSVLLDELKDIWNSYFEEQDGLVKLNGPVVDLIGNYKRSDKNFPKVQLNREQRKTVIDLIENDIKAGKMKYLECRAYKIQIRTHKLYNTLSEFLEESGVVYKVENSSVYIWDDYYKEFKQLVGYESNKEKRYCLYLL